MPSGRKGLLVPSATTPVRVLPTPGTARRRLVGAVLALATPLSLVAVAFLAPAPAGAAPANPSDTQLARAAAAKAQAAKDVGRLSGLIAAADAQIDHLDGLAELAKDRYLKAIWDLSQAKASATKAQASVVSAQTSITTARTKYREFIVSAYMNRGSDSGGLLVATNANEALTRSDLTAYTASRQISAIGDLSRATVDLSNADAQARTAVQAQTNATTTAASAQKTAVNAVNTAQSQRIGLTAQKSSYQTQLQAAGEALTGLQNKRAAFLAWQAAQRAAALAEARREAAARAAEIRAQQAAAAQAQAQAQAQQNQSSSSSSDGSTSSSGGDTGSTGQSVIGNGIWTAAKGRAAAQRALGWLGERYSFAAGNYTGPTWGACVTDDSGWNDCHVFGFDCSGLAMYAWSPAGIFMPHYAASQYSYGSVHPSLNQLLPGDLVFWSSDGTIAGIHHVAIYIGNGQVVQAPQSGDVVKISYIWMDEYYGATRPGS